MFPPNTARQNDAAQFPAAEAKRGKWVHRMAWLPIPLLLAVIAGLWVADLRTVCESRGLMVLLNLLFPWLASLCICFLTARGFLAGGQPGLLMFGCGSLLWGTTSLAAAVLVNSGNTTVTLHNLGVFGAALCHLAGLLWHGRLTRPGRWLVAGYAGALMTAALVLWVAAAGLTPPFFLQGQGGTPVRQIVLLSSIAMFAWVALQIVCRSSRQYGTFYYWYGLGLALVATGLTGVLLLSVQGGPLGWVNRLTQYLGSAYLLIAAVSAARETDTWKLSLSALEEELLRDELLPVLRRKHRLGWVLRYGSAFVAVAAAYGLTKAITVRFGPGFPPYLLFWAAGLVVMFLGGFGPGLVVLALTDIVVGIWVFQPYGQLVIASQVDRLGMLVFTGVFLALNITMELYQRTRDKAAAFDREAATRENRERLATFAEATFEGIIESEAGRILDCNEQFARMAGYSVAELRGKEIASMIAPEDCERVMAGIQRGLNWVIEHAILRKDGTPIVVEARGRPVFPGSPRRHTAIRDLTERKKVEAVEARYEILSRYARDPLLLMETSGKIVEANQAAVTFYGYSHEALLELNIQDLRRGDDAETLQRQARESTARGILFESMHTRKNGTRIPVEVSSRGVTIEGRRMLLSVVRDITARKIAMEMLREEEELLESVLNSSLSGIMVFKSCRNAQSVIEDFEWQLLNQTAEKLVGRHKEELLGRKLLEVMPGNRKEGLFDLYVDVVETGIPLDHEHSYEHEQIRTWFQTTAVKLGDGLVITFNNISERKQAEKALRAAKMEAERYAAEMEALLDAVPAAVFTAHDPQCNTISGNRLAQELLGLPVAGNFSKSAPAGEAPSSFRILKDGREIRPEQLPVQMAARGQNVRGYELDFVFADGTLCTMLGDAVPLLDESGAPRGAVGAFIDITAHKRIEQALLESRERLELALRSSRMAPFDWDIVRDKRTWSDGVHKLMGTEASSFQGTPEEFFGAIHPEDRDGVQAAVAVAFETGDYETNFRVVWRDGSTHHISSRGKVHRDNAGQPVRLAGVSWDISERKETEQRLKASLREKEAMLKEIHHRVKNNMQVISSLVSLQADALKDPAMRGLFQDVRDRVRSMAMVHEKLYQSASLANVEFGDYARSLMHYLWRAHGSAASGIWLNFDLKPVHLPVELAVPCGLILNELAVNALKHAFRGRSSGAVTVTLGTSPDGCIRLGLADDGAGLPPGQDWRQSSTLGLRLVQMLAGQLNGAVETGPGPGAEFTLTFGPVIPKSS